MEATNGREASNAETDGPETLAQVHCSSDFDPNRPKAASSRGQDVNDQMVLDRRQINPEMISVEQVRSVVAVDTDPSISEPVPTLSQEIDKPTVSDNSQINPEAHASIVDENAASINPTISDPVPTIGQEVDKQTCSDNSKINPEAQASILDENAASTNPRISEPVATIGQEVDKQTVSDNSQINPELTASIADENAVSTNPSIPEPVTSPGQEFENQTVSNNSQINPETPASIADENVVSPNHRISELVPTVGQEVDKEKNAEVPASIPVDKFSSNVGGDINPSIPESLTTLAQDSAASDLSLSVEPAAPCSETNEKNAPSEPEGNVTSREEELLLHDKPGEEVFKDNLQMSDPEKDVASVKGPENDVPEVHRTDQEADVQTTMKEEEDLIKNPTIQEAQSDDPREAVSHSFPSTSSFDRLNLPRWLQPAPSTEVSEVDTKPFCWETDSVSSMEVKFNPWRIAPRFVFSFVENYPFSTYLIVIRVYFRLLTDARLITLDNSREPQHVLCQKIEA